MLKRKLFLSLAAEAVKRLRGLRRFTHWGVEELCCATHRSSTQTALWDKANMVTSRFVISFVWQASCCVAMRYSYHLYVSELTGNLLPASSLNVYCCLSRLLLFPCDEEIVLWYTVCWRTAVQECNQVYRKGKELVLQRKRAAVSQLWKMFHHFVNASSKTDIVSVAAIYIYYFLCFLKVIIGMTLLSGDPCFKTWVVQINRLSRLSAEPPSHQSIGLIISAETILT